MNFDKENIIFSTGEFRNRFYAQDSNSIFGKTLIINKKSGNHKIFSKGHRNIQGLLVDKENGYLLSTEHGPYGGDEINLHSLEIFSEENFGWPIASYGMHYKSSLKRDKKVYKKYPLYKSHKKYGYKEPIKYFTPSIGISEITKLNDKKYLVTSLKAKSFYTFSLVDKKVTNIEKFVIGDRIRDLTKDKEKIYFFLEETASIGILKL